MRSTRFGRRRLVRSAFAALAAGVAGGGLRTVRADYYRPPDPFAGTVAPPIVYVDQTGHHMEGVFAQFWHNAGGRWVLGFPITETLVEDGLRTQYFENFRLQYVPSARGDGDVRVTPLGRSLVPFPPAIEPPAAWPPFATFIAAKRADGLLGPALSVPYWEGNTTVQWFQNAKLEGRRGRDGQAAVWAASLGAESAGLRGAETSPVLPEPGALDPRPRNFTRWFETDLTKQTVTFWEAGFVVHEAVISSGKIRPTPIGQFSIYRRVENERMVGGEPGTSTYYDLDNVLYTQYFSRWFDALHYAYWHNNFGQPMSHGCLNMKLDDSALAWRFGTHGTVVEVHA
jgi:hypothetical protein